MDIRRKLAVTLAAMSLAGQLGAVLPAAAASRTQLETLQAFMASGDLAGLARFVEQSPDLLDQPTPLAQMLADFLVIFRGSDRLTAFPPVVVSEIKDSLAAAVRAELY